LRESFRAWTAYEELGTGEQQVLAISFAHAYAGSFRTGFILAIEEPEAHLHPLAQAWLAEKIHEMCADGLQIILTTHSPPYRGTHGKLKRIAEKLGLEVEADKRPYQTIRELRKLRDFLAHGNPRRTDTVFP
jgi:predicted ATPase